MSPNTHTTQEWVLSSVALHDAYTDFILSRQAALVTKNTLLYYKFTIGLFIRWIEEQGIGRPDELQARHIREYLAGLAGQGKSDRTVADHAGAIRTLLRFWYAEKYLPSPIDFEMPKVAKKRLLVLDVESLKKVIGVCNPRDKALILVMVDSGLRRQEIINLNWGDLDMSSGLLRVKQGKGKKDRSSVIGATTRRILLRYRRTLANADDKSPMFQSRYDGRFTGKGFREIFVRISRRSGVKVTAHSLRRTFAILSLRAGMSPLHLQALGGWESLEMVKHYAQMVDDDILQAHHEYSPIDNLGKLK